jgi:Erythromycin esterase
LAARNEETYLEKVDPQEAKVAAIVFAPVSDAGREREAAGKSRVFWDQMEDRLQTLVERMENRKKGYVEASSLEAWILARHNLEIVKQAAEMYAADKLGNVRPRDVAMAIRAGGKDHAVGAQWARVDSGIGKQRVDGRSAARDLRGADGGVWICVWRRNDCGEGESQVFGD